MLFNPISIDSHQALPQFWTLSRPIFYHSIVNHLKGINSFFYFIFMPVFLFFLLPKKGARFFGMVWHAMEIINIQTQAKLYPQACFIGNSHSRGFIQNMYFFFVWKRALMKSATMAWLLFFDWVPCVIANEKNLGPESPLWPPKLSKFSPLPFSSYLA